MAEYRNDDGRTTVVERRRGMGGVLGIILVLAVVVIGILFATGFFSAKVSEGEMPSVSVKADAGALPDVDVESKEVVVGTKTATVEVPTVETQKETIEVPVVGVKD